MPRKAVLQIYKSFIRPHLDYCDVIYHKPTYDDFNSSYYSVNAKTDPVSTNSHFTHKIAITGCVRGTSREILYSELGLTSPYDRRRFHRLPLFYKILNELTPAYLRHCISEPVPRL